MSDEEKLKEGEFRVVDKRRFTSEGDSRAEVEERKSAPEPKKEPSSARVEREAKSSSRSTEEVDFSSLIVSLATQALMMMGEVPGSEASGTKVNLEAARQTIDVLGLLEVKTKGNLNTEEQKLMADILSNLRLAYVKKSGSK